MAKTTAATIVEPTDEDMFGEQDNETSETSAPAATASTPGVVDTSAMTNDEILKVLADRRAALSAINKVAKEKGIKVTTEKAGKVGKSTMSLDELGDKLGYSTGMRHWADSRMTTVRGQIEAHIEALGEAWGPEKQQELLEAVGTGYLRAKIGSSFPSERFKDKATAEKAHGGDAVEEVLERIAALGTPVPTFLIR